MMALHAVQRSQQRSLSPLPHFRNRRSSWKGSGFPANQSRVAPCRGTSSRFW